MTFHYAAVFSLAALAAFPFLRARGLLAAAKRPGGKGKGPSKAAVEPRGRKPRLEAKAASPPASRNVPLGWPAWGFAPMGAMMENGRRESERFVRQGGSAAETGSRYFDGLRAILKAVYGPGDPRVWGALSRAARGLLGRGEYASAVCACAEAAVEGLERAESTSGPVPGEAEPEKDCGAGGGPGAGAEPEKDCGAEGGPGSGVFRPCGAGRGKGYRAPPRWTLRGEAEFARSTLDAAREELVSGGLAGPDGPFPAPAASASAVVAAIKAAGREAEGGAAAEAAPEKGAGVLREELAGTARDFGPGSAEELAARSLLGAALADSLDPVSAGEARELLRGASEGLDALLGGGDERSLEAKERYARFLKGDSGPFRAVSFLGSEDPPEEDLNEALALYLEVMAGRAGSRAVGPDRALRDAEGPGPASGDAEGPGPASGEAEGPGPAAGEADSPDLATGNARASGEQAARRFAEFSPDAALEALRAEASAVRKTPAGRGAAGPASQKDGAGRTGGLRFGRGSLSAAAAAGEIQLSLGLYKKAGELLGLSFRIAEATLGGQDPVAIRLMAALADLPGPAFVSDALGIAEFRARTSMGLRDPRTIRLTSRLAELRLRQKMTFVSIAFMAEAAEVLEELDAEGADGGLRRWEALALRTRMAEAFYVSGDIEAGRLALEGRVPLTGGRHPYVSVRAWFGLSFKALQTFANIVLESGDPGAAASFYRQALDVLNEYSGGSPQDRDLPVLASCFWALGQALLLGGGDPAEAEGLFARAAEIYGRLNGRNSRMHLNALSGRADALEAQGDSQAALELHLEVLEARKGALGIFHPDTEVSRKRVERLGAIK
ncbi:MAG: tetratricopeptide repeat protein [Deltaproteobacteria bacterium]|jgi:tetratricopeptide (TPR) repeat protein|nr:tetratricopeptide repeat protein [Deltaproteobacteria bacterium]